MFKYTLPAVLAAALWTTVYPVFAQEKPAAQQTPVPAQPGTPLPQVTPQPPKPTAGTDVVGTVFGKQITWDQLIARIAKSYTSQFDGVAAQVSGPKVASALFDAPGQSTVTITKDEVITAIRQNPPPIVGQMLDVILIQDALEMEAAKQGIVVTDAAVNDRIKKILDGIRKSGRIHAGTTDDQYLAANHTSREQLFNNYKPQMLGLTLVDKDLAKKMGHPIGPEDFIQARHILIRAMPITSASSAKDKQADADAKVKIVKILAEIKSGKKTFEQAADQYTDDPGGKAHGGDLGVFMRGSMVPEFDAVVFKLKPGEISEPVRSTFGYHIIQVTKLGKDIPEDQRQPVLERKESELLRTYIGELHGRANITNVIRIAPTGMPGNAPN